MITIDSLRRQRAELNDQVQALAKISETETLSAEQSAEFDRLSTEFDQVDANIKRLEKAEEMNAAAAEPVKAADSAPAVHVKKEVDEYKGAAAARTMMAIAAGGGDATKAVNFAADKIGDQNVAMAIETSASSGGALIPQNVADEVIELLRPRTVVRKLGARSIPLPNGNTSIPRLSGGATSSYVGEGSDAQATEATLDDVQLSAKTLITLVPISNQMIGRTGRRIEQIVLNDMIAAMASREDKAFLRDDGTGQTPTGFKKTASDEGRTKAFSGSADLATIDAYLDSLILELMQSESLMIMPGWALSP